ncbi:MAG: hypothetical protein R3185_02795, partial [Candidatus Thermoplasmatota archaeon]|nr:hypothetical protein [Candidatus Thermoplasmatota archaeon]
MNGESPFQFTRREIFQLVASTLVLAAAFSFPLSCSYIFESFLVASCGAPGIRWDQFLFPALPVSIAIVLAAFVLHELAHKLVAQHYGMWAEFRASLPGLGIALVISGVMGVVVASPGAVLIYPNPKPRPAYYETERAYEQAVATYEADLKRQSGVISVAGPIVNIAFAVLSWPLWLATDQNAAFDVGLANVGNFFQLAML